MTGVYLRMSNQRPGKLQKPLDRKTKYKSGEDITSQKRWLILQKF